MLDYIKTQRDRGQAYAKCLRPRLKLRGRDQIFEAEADAKILATSLAFIAPLPLSVCLSHFWVDWFHDTTQDVSFLVAGACTWNDLPVDVTSAPSLLTFRKRLKLHLFRLSYRGLVL